VNAQEYPGAKQYQFQNDKAIPKRLFTIDLDPIFIFTSIVIYINKNG
jgi:hypothetical protein